MKKTHIAAIVMVIAAIVMLVLSSQEFSTFSTFEQARLSDRRVKVSGSLSKVDPMVYNPEVDANYFSFYMTDEDNVTEQVIIKEKKPRDFERSESIVLTGKWNDDHFAASEMLLKCPSKYKNEELALRNQVKISAVPE